jgi:hypothetical protein
LLFGRPGDDPARPLNQAWGSSSNRSLGIGPIVVSASGRKIVPASQIKSRPAPDFLLQNPAIQ